MRISTGTARRALLTAPALALAVMACGGGEAPDASTTTSATTTATAATTATTAPTTTAAPAVEPEPAPEFAAGPLGAVRVDPGGEIQIRAILSLSGVWTSLGVPNYRVALLAMEDYGPIQGFSVNLGEALDSLCTSEGGAAAATRVAADPQTAAVLGTTCSSAAAGAMPVLSEAGLSMVSSSNASSTLTSNLEGSAGSDHYPGYYRISHNDLHRGLAVAEFATGELRVDTAAVVHEGNLYSQDMTEAFAGAFAGLGGEVTASVLAEGDPGDVRPALEEIAASSPGVLFFPYYEPWGDAFVQQAQGIAGLRDTVFIGYGSGAGEKYDVPDDRSLYLTIPDQRFGGARHEITGRSADEIQQAYRDRYGEAPTDAFWVHAYDATVMLLDSIDAAAAKVGDSLFIDRAGLRDALDAADLGGITGRLACDDFGDCADPRVILVDAKLSGSDALLDNVVFSYAPSAAPGPEPPEFAAGPLGAVRVGPGGEIQIRALLALSGEFGYLGVPAYQMFLLAVEDYGPVQGFSVNLGGVLDSMCSAEGGASAAAAVLADPQVAGTLGTACSSAAAAAMSAFSEAGLSMVSSINTSATLTSNLQGAPGSDHFQGFYRVSHNDLHEGMAVAEFATGELQADTAALIHEGDLYSEDMTGAFADAFTGMGGEVTASLLAEGDPAGVRPVLEEIAASSPEVLFFPHYPPRGKAYVQQAQGVAGLRDTVFIGYGYVPGEEYDVPADRTLYLSLPEQRFGDSRHEITGRSGNEILRAHRSRYGENPADIFWAHAYDAAVMLLHSIDAAATKQGDSLFIDRAGLRDALDAVDLDGITGRLACDDFGDCGAAGIIVARAELSGSDAFFDDVVFAYRP